MTDPHRCNPPSDRAGRHWTGPRDGLGGDDHPDGTPCWGCPDCGRWWGYGWPGQGSGLDARAWMPLLSVFVGHEPDAFAALLAAYYGTDDEDDDALVETVPVAFGRGAVLAAHEHDWQPVALGDESPADAWWCRCGDAKAEIRADRRAELGVGD